MLPLSVLALVLVLCVSRQSDGQEKSRRSRRWHRSIQICIFRKSVSSGNISDPWEKRSLALGFNINPVSGCVGAVYIKRLEGSCFYTAPIFRSKFLRSYSHVDVRP